MIIIIIIIISIIIIYIVFPDKIFMALYDHVQMNSPYRNIHPYVTVLCRYGELPWNYRIDRKDTVNNNILLNEFVFCDGIVLNKL